MQRSILLTITCSLLASCAGSRESGKPGMALWGHPEVNSSASCATIGGYWFKSKSGDYLCDAPIADAGKACKDSIDCEGSCLADVEIAADSEVTGRCDKWHIVAGRCVNEVRSGRAVGKVCGG